MRTPIFRSGSGLRLHGLVAAVCFLLVLSSGRAGLVINEVCFDNATLGDETNNVSSDWIELYNTGPGSLNIKNYAVGDANPFDAASAVLLPDYTMPAGGYLVVFANADLPQYTFWTNAPDLALIPANDTWRYYTAATAPAANWYATNFSDSAWASGISPLGYNDASLNMDCATVLSYGSDKYNRYPAAYFRKTFQVTNRSAITNLIVKARVDDAMVLYLNGTAVLSDNPALVPRAPTKWITNSLSPSWLVDGTNTIAVQILKSPLSSADLMMDLTLTAQRSELVPVVHAHFSLANAGENVHLFNPALTRIQRFPSPGFEIGQDKSYGLEPDGVITAFKVYKRPTPGRSNTTYPQKYSETLTSQKPLFSVPPGVYAGAQNVVLSTPTAGYRIFYTLDGSSPWDSTAYVFSGSPVTINPAAQVGSGLSWLRTAPAELSGQVPEAVWQPPIGTVDKAVVLRAIAVSVDGKYCSPETRGTYFIGPQFTNRTLPIVSLTIETNDFFAFTTGIYVPGKTYADSPYGYGDNRWGKPYANYHQDGPGLEWERPVHFELIESSRSTPSVSQLLGVAMQGGGTRTLPEKALYLMARLGEYGTDTVNYSLFPDLPFSSYKRFLLRTSGNDWYGPGYGGVATMLRDAVFHRIVQSLDMSIMAYRPTVTYLNGEYWGIHNLRESLDKHYLATRYSLEPDGCDLLMHEDDPDNNSGDYTVNITRISGDLRANEDYKLKLGWIKTNPPVNAANYAELQQWMDVTNYADYIIAETFFGNIDWPLNNCEFWRSRTNQPAAGKYGDGRWRWMLYDLDVAGLGGDYPYPLYLAPYTNMFTFLAGPRMQDTNKAGFLINQLWKNSEFKAHFVSRYVNLLNTTFDPGRTHRIIGAAADGIAPEIETHFHRWGRGYTRAQWQNAVTNARSSYAATRYSALWGHLNTTFYLGGTGTLAVRNNEAGGSGGRFTVNGILIDTTTDGVTNRAAWTGTFFRTMSIPVVAVPDPGYAFDGWVGTALTNATLNVAVSDTPLTLTARFRPAAAPPSVPTGFQQWQLANYTESEVLRGVRTAPDVVPVGCSGLSNFQLYAFGMGRNDGLTDDQRLARVSLAVANHNSAFWLGYTRLNSSYTDVAYTLKVTPRLDTSVWTNAVPGVDLDPVTRTNVLDPSTWYYETRLPAGSSAPDVRFFRLEAAPQ